MITITLITPQIPQNTGNIARLCVGANFRLHLVGDLGFKLSNRYLKRAGLDYWHLVNYQHYVDTTEYLTYLKEKNSYFFTTKTTKSYTKINFKKNDFIIFGSEIKGINNQILLDNKNNCYTIPMVEKTIRSYNLSSSVAIVAFEALRQINLAGNF